MLFAQHTVALQVLGSGGPEMGDHLDRSARLQLKAHTIDESRKVVTIYKEGEISIQAVSVHHGPIPAVAYRVNVGNKSITFSGDMNGDYHTSETLAKDTHLSGTQCHTQRKHRGSSKITHDPRNHRRDSPKSTAQKSGAFP